MAPVRALLLDSQAMDAILGLILLLKAKRIIHKLLIGNWLVMHGWVRAHKITNHGSAFRYTLPVAIVRDRVVLFVALGSYFLVS